MSAEEGIRRTLANYCRLFDSKQWDALGDLFAEHATITSRRGTFRGRAEVARDLKGALTDDYHGTLFTSNSLIAVDGDTATAFSDFLAVEDTKILAIGTYADTFVRSGDDWRFTSKEIRLK